MKKAILVLVILVGYMAHAQQDVDSTVKSLKKYRTMVNSGIWGYLVNINDSSLRVSYSNHPFRKDAESVTYPYHKVDKVQILRAAHPLTGALICGVLGVVAGCAVGKSIFIHNNPDNTVFLYGIGQDISSLEGAIVGAATGAAAGLLIGSIKHKFQVSRDREKFKKLYAYINR